MVRLDLKTKHKTYLLSKRNSFLKKDKDRLKIKEQKRYTMQTLVIRKLE